MLLACVPVGTDGRREAQRGGGPVGLDPVTARDLGAIRAGWPERAHLVDELATALRDDLPYAQAVLAVLIAPGDEAVRQAAAGPAPETAAILRALGEAARRRPAPGAA